MEKQQHYHKVSELYKEIVDTLTKQELGQVKLYCSNLGKKIAAKEPVYAEFRDSRNLLDALKEAKGKVALHYACARGDVSIVAYLVESIGLDVHVKDKEGNTPFFTAVEHGNLDLVRYFVDDRQLSALAMKDGNISALHLASNNNHIELMKYLLEKGCDIEKMSIYGKPINWAVGSRHIEATKFLLEKGADPNGDETCPAPPPLIIAIDFGCKQIYEALLNAPHPINLNAADGQGFTALHIAAEKGELEIVKDLVKRGADLDIQAQNKKPLYLAFENNQWETVQYLRQKTKNASEVEQKVQKEKQAEKKVQIDEEKSNEMKAEGNKLYGEKKYEEALQKYHQALTFNPHNEVVHRNMAACYLPLKKYQQALEHCHKAKLENAKNVKTLYREAQAYIGLGDLVDAAASLWECAMLQPQTPYFKQQFQKYVNLAKQQHGNKN